MKYLFRPIIASPGGEWHECSQSTFKFYSNSANFQVKVESGSGEVDYGNMVKTLAKDGGEILKTLTPEKVHAMHMSFGVAGESGELIDEIKKFIAYDREFNRENVIKEMGDLEFYLEGLRQGFGITREEVLKSNISKLSERYGEHFEYSDQKANARVDVKQEK